MGYHHWSEKDINLLKNNIKILGASEGCKKTSKELNISYPACQHKAHRLEFTTSKRRKLTEEEINIIINCVKESTRKNKIKALKKASELTGVSYHIIKNYWYDKKIKNNTNNIVNNTPQEKDKTKFEEIKEIIYKKWKEIKDGPKRKKKYS